MIASRFASTTASTICVPSPGSTIMSRTRGGSTWSCSIPDCSSSRTWQTSTNISPPSVPCAAMSTGAPRRAVLPFAPPRTLSMLDRLHRLTFARQGIERESEEVHLLQSVAQSALEKGFGELLTCLCPDGKVASAILFLYDRCCAYYWVAANDPDYRKSGCATYLMVEGIRHWHAKGVGALDFIGINSPNRGDFKTSFNAVPVPYFIATWERPADSRAR